jgi:selenocysteine lyase/cysteine desulfurase
VPQSPSFAFLREQTVGADALLTTPFGERLMVYCDYTASGRCLRFVENYLLNLQRTYANTHTEDDTTGRNMTQLLRQAETLIKASVNAGPGGRIVAVGTGATGAINKLQQILGVYWPPATRALLAGLFEECLGPVARERFTAYLAAHQPVVFVGPFEHHSNEVSWREGLATVVEVQLGSDGGIDLEHLRALLLRSEYQGRLRIGSFSAASNVTGMRTPIAEIARLLHRHDAIVCVDFAASAPYQQIDMNPPPDAAGDASLDAIFVSPHKFLGGPGSSGILVFSERLYQRQLPPTVAAGGTVEYVSEGDQDFIADIEDRERPGTPGTLQVLKAALAFAVKDWIGVAGIERREQQLLAAAMDAWRRSPHVEVLGNPDPQRRIAIVSFNLKDPAGRYLHPKFVTALLNDLFGIQSRAGCSCAGPYGHRLLEIDAARSAQYRQWVTRGYGGIKPGWCRVGFHYAMDDVEASFVVDAVLFIAEYGYRFLPSYRFDLGTGAWTHREGADRLEELSLTVALEAHAAASIAKPAPERAELYRHYLEEARRSAEMLSGTEVEAVTLSGELGDLQFFALTEPVQNRGMID